VPPATLTMRKEKNQHEKRCCFRGEKRDFLHLGREKKKSRNIKGRVEGRVLSTKKTAILLWQRGEKRHGLFTEGREKKKEPRSNHTAN